MHHICGVKLNRNEHGMTFVGVIVATALLTIVFTSLFATFVTLIDIISRQKGETGAVALANERIEYIRSLPYSSVGTLTGLVPGVLPENSTTSLNGIEYSERIYVQYIDDEADGTVLGTGDIIPTDYKVVKVEYTWDHKGSTSQKTLISNVVPNGIETTVGGGTLVINVYDSTVQPVDGAEIRIINNSTTSTIDTTVTTNATGRGVFPGAAAAANYEISVTKVGYSTDQTYSATGTNSNPSPAHVAVVQDGVSSITFSIDELSEMNFFTRSNPVVASSSDTFVDSSLLNQQASTTVSSGSIVLTDILGVYDALGTAQATVTAPSTLNRWLYFDSDQHIPPSTDAYVQLFWVSSGGTYTLIGDIDVPGNSSGFSSGIVDISSLSTSTFPRLALVATLQTSDTATTSEIRSWGIQYETSATPVGNVTIDAVGNKTIGTTASFVPISKHVLATTTNASGVATLSDVEWDVYDISIDGATEGYDIAEACSNVPIALNPNVSEDIYLTLEPHVSNSLRVMVVDGGSSTPVPNASVRLHRSGFDTTLTTGVCGQTFFNSGVPAASDYDIDVTASGYLPENVVNVDVSGNSYIEVSISS